jgi:hypothetical protein
VSPAGVVAAATRPLVRSLDGPDHEAHELGALTNADQHFRGPTAGLDAAAHRLRDRSGRPAVDAGRKLTLTSPGVGVHTRCCSDGGAGRTGCRAAAGRLLPPRRTAAMAAVISSLAALTAASPSVSALRQKQA